MGIAGAHLSLAASLVFDNHITVPSARTTLACVQRASALRPGGGSLIFGGVAERLKASASRCAVRATVSKVRILSPSAIRSRGRPALPKPPKPVPTIFPTQTRDDRDRTSHRERHRHFRSIFRTRLEDQILTLTRQRGRVFALGTPPLRTAPHRGRWRPLGHLPHEAAPISNREPAKRSSRSEKYLTRGRPCFRFGERFEGIAASRWPVLAHHSRTAACPEPAGS